MSATGDAARQYAEAGWSLVPIDGGRKGPTFRGWNLPQRCVTDPDTAAEIDGNVGLAHAYSRTCVIDVDDLATARDWLADRGIDLAELMSAPDAVMISSGRRNRGKLLYRLPDGGEPLMSRRPTGSGLELRCGSGGGLTVQDVLPPSIHPDTGQPYKWIFGEVGHWSCPPVLPDALLQLWQAEATVQEPAATAAPSGAAPERIRGILSRIDPDIDYNDWAKVGAALHHESAGASWGLDLWDEWSATGSKYKSRDDLVPHWRSWGRYQGRMVTLQWLMGQAGGVDADDFDDLTVVPQQPPKPPRFEIVSLTDFSAGSPPEWIVKHWIARAGLGIIYGESGAGKSFIMLDLAMHIATGRPWNAKRVRQGRVVYICAEGQAGFRNRVRAYCQQHEIDPATVQIGVISDVPNLLLQDHQLLSERVNAWGGADVVIIDTLAQTTPGSNENSSEDMGKALSHIRAMHSATGAMMLLVHHAGKDLTRGARGWSGIKAAADSEIEITRDGDQRQVRVSKQKDGEDGLGLHFVLREVALGFDSDGDAITSCIVEYVDPPAQGKAREPGGTWPVMVWRAVLEMHELTGDGADREAVLQRAIDQMPRDPDKDRRRENARRALEGLVKGEWVRMDGEQVCVMASKLPRSARG